MIVKWQSDAPKMELKVPSEVKIDGYTPTDEELTFTTTLTAFENNQLNWFFEKYKDRITTKDLKKVLFKNNTKIQGIPFDINMTMTYNNPVASSSTAGIYFTQMFKGCNNLIIPPRIKTQDDYTVINTEEMFSGCENLIEFPVDFFDNCKFEESYSPTAYLSYDQRYGKRMFEGCFKLKSIECPWTARIPKGYSGWFYSDHPFDRCWSLQEIKNIGISSIWEIWNWSFEIGEVDRLKHIVFQKMESAKMKNAWINLDGRIGFSYRDNTSIWDEFHDWNKRIKDDATYQALKDDPEAFTLLEKYAFYNHNSAVETINSLPDTSAYLAEKGGTNTITFKGELGSKTDSGAINTMTAEEIAVAAAKGWTVAFN